MNWQRFVPLKANKIYILPTRAGLLFGSAVFIMLLAAAGYGNNLIYLLFFMLTAIFLVSMVQTHSNLKRVVFKGVIIEPASEGEQHQASVQVANESSEEKLALTCSLFQREHLCGVISINTLGKKTLSVARGRIPSRQRGLYCVDKVRLATTYPLGLFYAWTFLPTCHDYFSYPVPKGVQALPPPLFDEGDADEGAIGEEEDFKEHRPFQRGDSYQRVDWKAVAKGHPLLVKRFEGGGAGAWMLDWRMLQTVGEEEKLSQMTAWAIQLMKKNAKYAMKLPHGHVEAGRGQIHFEQCLRELACFPAKPAPTEDGVFIRKTS